MDNLQIIRSPKGEEMVVLSRKEYDLLVDAMDEEDRLDAKLAAEQMRKIKAGKTALIPHDVVVAIAVKGVNPVRAFREHRGWTAEQLARKTRLARTTISQIETGARKGTVAAYKAIAKAFGVGVQTLID